ELKSRTEQATIITLALREALSILEMPLPDFAQWLQQQIEQNPALQFEEVESEEWEEEPHNQLEGLTAPPEEISWIEQIEAPAQTLYSHLLGQAREILSCADDLKE